MITYRFTQLHRLHTDLHTYRFYTDFRCYLNMRIVSTLFVEKNFSVAILKNVFRCILSKVLIHSFKPLVLLKY